MKIQMQNVNRRIWQIRISVMFCVS